MRFEEVSWPITLFTKSHNVTKSQINIICFVKPNWNHITNKKNSNITELLLFAKNIETINLCTYSYPIEEFIWYDIHLFVSNFNCKKNFSYKKKWATARKSEHLYLKSFRLKNDLKQLNIVYFCNRYYENNLYFEDAWKNLFKMMKNYKCSCI